MDTLDCGRDAIEQFLRYQASLSRPEDDFQSIAVIDRNGDNYLLMSAGWSDGKRVHGCVVHVDVVGDQFWIEKDGTEEGIAAVLLQAGIPKSQIVPAWRRPDIRNHPEFRSAWCESA